MKSCRWFLKSILPSMLSAVFLLVSVPALAYHVKEISGMGVDWSIGAEPSGPYSHQMTGYAGLNDSGMAVWSEEVGSYYQVFRFADGVGEQITADNNYNLSPQIAENGDIVWAKQKADGSSDICQYDPVANITLFSDGRLNADPQVNSEGDVVWQNYITVPINNYEIIVDSKIYFEQDSNITVLDNLGYNSSSPQINDSDLIAWIGTMGSQYAVLSYYAGETHLLATSSYAISNLRLNNEGQMVWQGSDRLNSEIYFYDINTGGQPQQISSLDNYDKLNPQINDSGAVVWQQQDEANYDICLYQPSGGSPVNLTHLIDNDAYFNHYSPQINNRGDVAWIDETTEAYSNMGNIGYWNIQIYNYIDLTKEQIELHPVLHMMTDNYLDGSLRLNELRQVMWQGHDNVYTTDSLNVSTPETYYQFNFYYNKENPTKGDYYKGYFCDEMYAYTKGQTKDVSIVKIIGEETQDVGTGYYEITEVLPDLRNIDYSVYPYGGVFGNVFVLSYYDYQSDTTFTPVHVPGIPGTGGLGSEGGWLYEMPRSYWSYEELPWSRTETYYNQFGSFYKTQRFEADVLQSRYDFEYHYNSSDDYYTGYVYAPPGTFEVGMQLNYLNGKYWDPLENGYYEIINQVDGFDVSTAYNFSVTSYYDSLYDSQMNPGQTDILPVSADFNWVYSAIPGWFGEEEGYTFGRTTSGQFSLDKEADLREKFRFVSFGDSQTSSGAQVVEYIFDLGSSVNTWDLSGTVDQILKLDPLPDFTVFLGDMGNWADDLGDELTANWKVWRDTVQPLYDYNNNTGIPIYPVAGNHDKYAISVIGDTMLGTLGYSKEEIYFWVLAIAPAAVLSGDPGALQIVLMRLMEGIFNYQEGVDAASRYSLESQDALTLQRAFVDQFVQEVKPGYDLPYYSMEYGNSYFSFLDSHYIDESLIDSDPHNQVFAPAHEYKYYFQEVAGSQLDWLIADVGQTSQFNKFAFAHKPAVSVGGAVDWDLWNFLDSREFNIFYGADEHLYARAFVDSAFLDSLTANNANNNTTHNVLEIVTGGLTDQFTLLDEVHQAWEDAEASGQTNVEIQRYHYVVTDVDSETTRTTAYELVERTRPEPKINPETNLPFTTKNIIGYDSDGVPIYEKYWAGDPEHEGDFEYGNWADKEYVVTEEVFDHWESVPFDWTEETKQIPTRNTGGESRYDFTCFYNNGTADHYSGYLYAPTGYQGYKVGYREEFTDENGQQGYYEITNQISLGANSGWDGTVYVTSYYDQETGRAFIPVGNDNPIGIFYLGSELGSIINNAEGHRFGQSYWEAEVDSVGYAFTFAYSDSLDQYTGIVYGPMEQYRIGDSRVTSFGSYLISGATFGLSAELENRVTLNQYTLGGADYTARGGDLAGYFGYGGLGSEQGYIISDQVPEYYFSAAEPARLVTYAYDFTYSYDNGSGDSYQGTLYAAPELNYSQAYTLSVPADENGQPGSYVITGVRTADASGNSFARSLDGQVFVDSYYNSENQQSYTPVGSDSPLGTGYFTSESGHIILDWVPEYAFGQGPDGQFCEADLVAYAYDYTFTFSNGDSYSGIVYAEPEKGYWSKDAGYSSFQSGSVEIGLTGEYTTDNMTPGFDVSLAGKVTVASYQDVEMKRAYVPTFTWGGNYLGSEYGYINLTDYPEKYHPADDFPPGINKFFFGNCAGMMYEADVKQDKKDKDDATPKTLVALNVTEPFVSYQPYDEEKNKSQKVK